MQRNRLQQQAQLQQIQLELEQEREDRQSRQKQQELEIQKSYDDQQVALRTKALEEAQQKIDQQVTAYKNKSTAQLLIQQRIAAGEDPDKVYLELGPQAFGTMTGASGFAKNLAESSRMAQVPEIQTARTDAGDFDYITNPKTMAPHFLPRGTPGPKEPTAAQLSTLINQASGINPKTPGFDPVAMSNIVNRAQSKLAKQLQENSADIGNEPVPKPFPVGKTADELKKILEKGVTYLHPTRGLIKWNGENADPVEALKAAQPVQSLESPPHDEEEDLPVSSDQE